MDSLITFTGGFPLECETLEFMQNTYAPLLGAISNLAGNKVILDGVETSGGNISAGFITYNKEIFPFVACPVGATVSIVQTIETVIYEDDQDSSGNPDEKDAYIRRFATTSPEVGADIVATFPFSDLVTVSSLRNSYVPIGAALLWFTNQIPAGYAACDGTNGTPDLRNKYIKAVGVEDAIATTGGANSKLIQISNLPAHTHTQTAHSHYVVRDSNAVGRPSIANAKEDAIAYKSADTTPPASDAFDTYLASSGSTTANSGRTSTAGGGNTGSEGGGVAFSVEPAYFTAIWIQAKGR